MSATEVELERIAGALEDLEGTLDVLREMKTRQTPGSFFAFANSKYMFARVSKSDPRMSYAGGDKHDPGTLRT